MKLRWGGPNQILSDFQWNSNLNLMEIVLKRATVKSNWLSIKFWLKSRRKLLWGRQTLQLIWKSIGIWLGLPQSSSTTIATWNLTYFKYDYNLLWGNSERFPLAFNLNLIKQQLKFILGCWAVFVEFHMVLIGNPLESPLDLLRANYVRFQ